jgi:hypothetical protein
MRNWEDDLAACFRGEDAEGMRTVSAMFSAVQAESLARMIHDEVCDDTPRCARKGEHERYYLDRAQAVIAVLEPEIGIAGVFTAVRVILDELW